MLQGLSTQEARKKLLQYGKNVIEERKKISPFRIFISQFTSPLIIILIIAAFISLLIESRLDAVLIGAIVFFSGITGFFQEWKAEKTIESLKKLATPKAKVLRDNEIKIISAEEIVPGDIVIVEEGDIIPADGKIIECKKLKVNEAVLTGESLDVEKKKHNKLFMGTSVTQGYAKFLVEKTGMRTQIGKIAEKIQEIEESKAGFQEDMERFSKKLSVLIIFITALVGIFAVQKYGGITGMLTAISLAVAAIPEGLPAVITISLALGAREMAKKKALIRKLAVIESIGAVDIICTDKTGTITENKMKVVKTFFNMDFEKPVNEKFYLVCALCNTTKVISHGLKKKIVGDQTEIALRIFAEENGYSKEELEAKYPVVDIYPFSPQRKMMSVICKVKEKFLLLSKGAPEVILKKCSHIFKNGKIVKLCKNDVEKIMEANNRMASSALRVLALAYKECDKKDSCKENELVFLGLVGLIDPPRKEVKQAIEDCKNAGIRVIMLTGDNPFTAKAIAREIGLETVDVIEGKGIDKYTDKELEELLKRNVNVFARVTPFHKLRILNILQKNHRVAMTGDGVNDALALKKASVGIAMGIRGTEVAKQASDIILLDDNFATIRDAVKEGRRIFDNIRKFVNYLLTCNLAEVFVIFFATVFLTLKRPILLPVQILWINLLTDGLPAIALAVDPARKNIMKLSPRPKSEGIINKKLALIISSTGIKMSVELIAVFFISLIIFGESIARTMLFTGFIIYEFIRIFVIRYQEKISFLANKFLLFALIISFILHLGLLYSPLATAFHVVPLSFEHWIILLCFGSVAFVTSIALTSFIIKYVK